MMQPQDALESGIGHLMENLQQTFALPCSIAADGGVCYDADHGEPVNVQQALTFEDQPGAPPSVWSVDDITRAIKRLLEQSFDRLWVEGEVLSCRPASSGHVYFKLKGQQATLSCVMFRGNASRLRKPLRDGDLVKCLGRVEVYAPNGQYQLIVQQAQFSGEGELLAKLEALRRKLHSEGLFDPQHKRPLPMLPRRVGVVTSPTGAAIRDIVRTIHERFPASILLAPAAVQGQGAAESITASLNRLAEVDDVDVIIVGRGGGSLEDLWAFNDEGLVRAIAACDTPVVSAVGHEIDTVLTDYVADYQAATPTGGAEAVVPEYDALVYALDDAVERSTYALTNQLTRAQHHLTMLAARIADPRRMISDRWQSLDALSHRMAIAVSHRQNTAAVELQALTQRLAAAHPKRQLAHMREVLQVLTARMERAIVRLVEKYRAQHRQLTLQLEALSPRSSLDRGYAIVRRTDGHIVRSHIDVTAGNAIEVLLSNGSFDATVDNVRTPEEEK